MSPIDIESVIVIEQFNNKFEFLCRNICIIIYFDLQINKNKVFIFKQLGNIKDLQVKAFSSTDILYFHGYFTSLYRVKCVSRLVSSINVT